MAISVPLLGPVRAHAANKDMVELQTQVQQLLDMVQRLQSTLDTRFGVLQHLVEQTADNANRMTQSVEALQQKINASADATNAKLDTASGQSQALNDSVDELKSRMAKLDKTIQDLQGQLQNLQNQGAPNGGAPGQAQPAPGGSPLPPSPGPGASSAAPGGAPPAAQAPPLQETYQAGLRDYNAARYTVAAGEFQDVVSYYPQDDLAGSAQFYLGEIAYRQMDYPGAVKAYNAVLESFSGSPKASAAQLRKGLALIQMNKRDAGIHELRLLIQRHPQTPEASQARSKLNSMGVRITASR
ncbi:MAG TPA: tetratricopeptide repeat protein [Terracidiphilus sp.]